MKAPALLIALGKRRGEKAEDDAPDSESGAYSDDEKEALGGDLLDAIKSNDKAGVYHAIESLVMACGE